MSGGSCSCWLRKQCQSGLFQMICRTSQLLAEVVDVSSKPEHVHKKGSMNQAVLWDVGFIKWTDAAAVFFNRQCWRQTETVKQMSYQQKVCIQVVGDSLSVHCQPLQAVLCAAFAVKSARHCNVFPLFAVDFQHIGHKQMESRKSCIAWLSPFDLILHTPSRGCVVACLACI